MLLALLDTDCCAERREVRAKPSLPRSGACPASGRFQLFLVDEVDQFEEQVAVGLE
jgi:hypothetical protein